MRSFILMPLYMLDIRLLGQCKRESVKARVQRALEDPFLATDAGATVMSPVLSPLDRVVDRFAWHREAMIWSLTDSTSSMPDRAGC